MKAPDGVGAEALWVKIKAIVGRLGVDADEVLVRSCLGSKSKLRSELQLVREWATRLHQNKNPTARQIAAKLQKAMADIERARCEIADAAKMHWPRRRLYEAAESRLTTALAEAAAILRSEHDVLDAAPGALRGNASSIEALFRRHAFRLWHELGGKRLERTDAIDFLVACENLMLGRPDRDAVRKWLARNYPQADTSS
jgi:hypothetical protein